MIEKNMARVKEEEEIRRKFLQPHIEFLHVDIALLCFISYKIGEEGWVYVRVDDDRHEREKYLLHSEKFSVSPSPVIVPIVTKIEKFPE